MQRSTIRIGCGAGFSGDRIEPAQILVRNGKLDYLVLECLAERTIALAQQRKLKNPDSGFDLLLEKRLTPLLPLLAETGTKLITNMGAANPMAAAKKIQQFAKSKSLNFRIAVIEGDDVLDRLSQDMSVMESGKKISSYPRVISANAYLGIEAILPGLVADANIIITGRVADPSLFLAPMVYEFGWDIRDYNLMGKGTAIGHLLECAGQLTGGYFADPVGKPVPDMHLLGHPFADVMADGTAYFGKVAETGGLLTVPTAKEQLLYEVLDPARYLTPDVTADFTSIHLDEVGENRVRMSGGGGIQRPDQLKVSVGYSGGYIGEGEISYAGAHAIERAQLAGQIISLRITHLFEDLKIDLLGVNALHGQNLGMSSDPYEVRLRVAGKTSDPQIAEIVGEEVEALYTNGPAGGGGARKTVKEILGIVSVLLDRKAIHPTCTILEG
jgi:hypothetical protein